MSRRPSCRPPLLSPGRWRPLLTAPALLGLLCLGGLTGPCARAAEAPAAAASASLPTASTAAAPGASAPAGAAADDGPEYEDLPSDTPAAPAGSRSSWHNVSLPGKASTRYQRGQQDGRAAWHAQADGSVSMWRHKVQVAPEVLGEVQFSWWVSALAPEAHVGEVGRTDAPARVLFAFDGDTAKLPLRTRLMFELARALTGEEPPYATLVYVWDATLPVGTVVTHPRSDRIRKIVIDSGASQLGRWREHRRNLAADFRLAFGEAPGTLQAIGLMTDSDNTRSVTQAWYGDVRLTGVALPASVALAGVKD